MRKLTPILAILVCTWLGLGRLTHREHRESPTAGTQIEKTATAPIAAERTIQQPVVALPATAPVLTHSQSIMRQHVFRLKLDRGNCTLENVEEVTGDFGRERFQRWQPGMFCCRLIAKDGRIVGERTMPAPDQICVVLDPNETSGTPIAARLTSDGPAVFQVRFPDISGAVRLEVHRISSETRPASAESVGPLIAQIMIPGK